MTREEAKAILEEEAEYLYQDDEPYNREAFRMAIKALENIGHLTDRPCDVCEFHTEQGCTQWKCAFCDELFGGMTR